MVGCDVGVNAALSMVFAKHENGYIIIDDPLSPDVAANLQAVFESAGVSAAEFGTAIHEAFEMLREPEVLELKCYDHKPDKLVNILKPHHNGPHFKRGKGNKFHGDKIK